MQSSQLEALHQTYEILIKDVQFDEIEHVPDQFLEKEISIQDNCLCISHRYFTLHYSLLMKELVNTKESELVDNHWITEMLLVMNGQNEKAWNIKKTLLGRKELDIIRELKFNATVCYKNKKSSTYYEYRIRLFEELVKEKLDRKELMEIYQSQSKLICKILARFLRNYYCWMYRNRLFKLFQAELGEELVKLEVNLLHKFVEVNPNDYSGYSRLIAVTKHAKTPQEQEKNWVQELRDFCAIAYESKESYRHLETYAAFLQEFYRAK